MYEGRVQYVLRCTQCNKPFDKQSTLKRHGYYCRSRKAGTTARSRSCIACAKKKARCDNVRPVCSRCITKANKCDYPTDSHKGAKSINHFHDCAPIEGQKVASSLLEDSHNFRSCDSANNIRDMIFEDPLGTADMEVVCPIEESVNYNGPFVDFSDFLNPQAYDEIAQNSSSESSSLACHSTTSIAQSVHVRHWIGPPNPTIPLTPTSAYRSLVKRPKGNPGTEKIATLLLHALKSYTRMMLRHDTLPPFVHPFSTSCDMQYSCTEPMTNCINLVHMINSRVLGSEKLFWKNVRLECERLCEDYLSLNKWELLSALQALSIYILVRIDEGETDHNNFDSLLTTAVVVTSKQLNCIEIASKAGSALPNYGLHQCWKDWIFEESIRRVCVIYQVLNMLVYFEPAAMCDLPMNLVLAPLPTRKKLWEAANEFVWKEESDRDSEAQSVFGMAASGDLIKLSGDRPSHNDAMLLHEAFDARNPSRSIGNWEEWFSGMDGFGVIIMLVASLIT